jgi:hypothetical protein
MWAVIGAFIGTLMQTPIGFLINHYSPAFSERLQRRRSRINEKKERQEQEEFELLNDMALDGSVAAAVFAQLNSQVTISVGAFIGFLCTGGLMANYFLTLGMWSTFSTTYFFSLVLASIPTLAATLVLIIAYRTQAKLSQRTYRLRFFRDYEQTFERKFPRSGTPPGTRARKGSTANPARFA